ncbi:MAG: hypothetical protein QF437_31260 [Planctomycetota bacterium]|nr:hypothetical protein [Planctomycetota bacterium]MDP7135018.1 hypothetical protein [Planctomycetota bacterium]
MMKHISTSMALLAALSISVSLSELPADDLVPIQIKLPKPAFVGTPKNIPPGTTVEKPTGKPRPPFKAPKGTKLISDGKKVSMSDNEPIVGEAPYVTDKNKEATEGSWLELGPGTQYVQIDLGAVHKIHAIVIWHYHGDPRVYKDVIVQLGQDKDFILDVNTVFNNDHDNSSGMGIGKDREYFEVNEGKLIDVKGANGRFVRLYSNGSTSDDMNHYTEVSVYGMPAK